MSILHYENWDGVTAPSLPSGWNFTSGAGYATSSTLTGGQTPTSSPNVLQITGTGAGGGTFYYAMWTTADTNSGNVTVQANFNSSGTNSYTSYCLVARANSATPASLSSYYIAQLQTHLSTLTIGNASTTLATLSVTGALSIDTWYQMIFTLLGTSLMLSVTRLSDGYWLNSSGTWQSGQTTAITLTDSSVTGAGYAGLATTLQFSGQYIWSDDWYLETSSAVVNPPKPMIFRVPQAYYPGSVASFDF